MTLRMLGKDVQKKKMSKRTRGKTGEWEEGSKLWVIKGVEKGAGKILP